MQVELAQVGWGCGGGAAAAAAAAEEEAEEAAAVNAVGPASARHATAYALLLPLQDMPTCSLPP